MRGMNAAAASMLSTALLSKPGNWISNYTLDGTHINVHAYKIIYDAVKKYL